MSGETPQRPTTPINISTQKGASIPASLSSALIKLAYQLSNHYSDSHTDTDTRLVNPTRRVQEPHNSASLSGIREEGPTCRATRAPRNLSLYTQNSKPKRQKLPNPPSDSVGFPSWEEKQKKRF